MAADSGAPKRKRHGMLKLYYGIHDDDPSSPSASTDPCDINGAHFKPEIFLSKLMNERSLTELMDNENDMVRQIRSLDSDMQTLVYENYNKFISATDTIRKMKNDFKKMEDEMDRLSTNMEAITESSASISSTLQDRRQQINKLSSVHLLLKKLQFLFELPARLNKCIELNAYGEAVRYYTRARDVLHQYQHMPSFKSIQDECSVIVNHLTEKLQQQFNTKDSSPKQLAICVDLLLQLGQPAEGLCDQFIINAKEKLDDDLDILKLQIECKEKDESTNRENVQDSESYLPLPMDVLEFVDCGCKRFLCNLSLVVASYQELFLRQKSTQNEEFNNVASCKLEEFVSGLITTYFDYVEHRVKVENESNDTTLLVRALDRFYRRLQSVDKLMPSVDIARTGTEIVKKAAHGCVQHSLGTLSRHFSDCITDVRQQLASPQMAGLHKPVNLSLILNNLETSLINKLKSILTSLQAFTVSNVTFAQKADFLEPFCSQEVREGLVVQFICYITSLTNEFCESMHDKGSTPPVLLLVLSRFCLDFEQSTIHYILSIVSEQFVIKDMSNLTSLSDLCSQFKNTSQKLLNHYVQTQGLIVSQMIRKSVETRDWLNTIEPRNVRAVMKRVVEDVTSIDTQVGMLYEEGVRKAHSHSSGSSRRTYGNYSSSRTQRNTQWSYTPSTSNFDQNLLSNIQKLFSERIEIFSAVESNKVSVLTGIVKISLKTFLECVRLRTFGRYGLQQIQVDTHYLQLYLWRFVSDENLVHVLLEEIVSSTVHRCVDSSLMEPSVVELICDRG